MPSYTANIPSIGLLLEAIREMSDDYLDSRLGRIVGGIGCLTLQVFADHDAQRCYAIEINPRFGGGFPLRYAAGADLKVLRLSESVIRLRLSMKRIEK